MNTEKKKDEKEVKCNKYNKLKLPHNRVWFKTVKHCAQALSKWTTFCNNLCK